MKRKLLYSVAFLILLVLLVPTIFAQTYTGKCGENLTFTIDTSTRILTISGEGEMENYDYFSTAPWTQYADFIQIVIVDDNVKSIGTYAFYNCYNLTSVTIGNNVTTIGDGAFEECLWLSRVTLGNSVKTIGEYAFYDCYSLMEITLPDSVTSIGSFAFSECARLYSVKLSDNITSLGDFTFMSCESLCEINIPKSIKSIGNGLFYDCPYLASVIIPAGVKTIGDNAFSNCYWMTSITIPQSVEEFGLDVFENCYSLTIYCYYDSPAYHHALQNGIAFVKLDTAVNTVSLAQIRTNDPQGMRYAAYIETATDGCEYGFIVTREELLKDLSGDTINYDLFKINPENPGYKNTAISGVTDKGLKYVGAIAINDQTRAIYSTTGNEFGAYTLGDGLYFTTVLLDITPDRYQVKFVGRPYMKTPDGQYYYGQTITRSIYEVAKAIPEENRDEYMRSIIETVENQPKDENKIDDVFVDVSGLLK